MEEPERGEQALRCRLAAFREHGNELGREDAQGALPFHHPAEQREWEACQDKGKHQRK